MTTWTSCSFKKQMGMGRGWETNSPSSLFLIYGQVTALLQSQTPRTAFVQIMKSQFTLWSRVSCAGLKLPDTHRVRVVQVADLTRHILCWWPCIHLACSRLFTWINYMTLSKELLQVSIKVPALFKQKGWEPCNSTLLELSKTWFSIGKSNEVN